MNASVDGTGGRGAVALIAPEAAEALDLLEATAWLELDPILLDAAASVIAAVNGIEPLLRPVDLGAGGWAGRDVREWRAFGDLAPELQAPLEFAEQFAADVSRVSDSQRSALFGTLAGDSVAFAQFVFAADVVPRTRHVLGRLFGSDDSPVGIPVGSHDTLRGAMERLIRVVPGLVALDPVTTELVRLRGARQHNCRMCQALRSRSAFDAGADDDTFAAVDHYATSSLPDHQRTALALTDAFIWSPSRIPDALVDSLRSDLSDAQQVELVLDITRNATNKLAVSLAADGTATAEGYEVYDVATDGTITYGLSRP